jgi:hypothetical protein
MLKSFMGKRPTTKSDVVVSVVAAVMAAYKAFSTYKEYKAEEVIVAVEEKQA